MNWRTTLGLLLLIAALASGWSAWREREGTKAPTSTESADDFILYDFQLVTLDKDTGKESMTLRAPEMHRRRADETSLITQPVFLLPDSQGLHWTMRAKTGWVSAKGEELRLRGDVHGDSPTEGDVIPTKFRTQRLDVFTDQSLAKTDDRVTMSRPGLMQTGVGFRANLKTKQYQLLSQVKTTYEPNAAR